MQFRGPIRRAAVAAALVLSGASTQAVADEAGFLRVVGAKSGAVEGRGISPGIDGSIRVLCFELELSRIEKGSSASAVYAPYFVIVPLDIASPALLSAFAEN